MHKNGKKYHSGTICGGVRDGFASYNLWHVIAHLGKKKQKLNISSKQLKIRTKSYKYNKIKTNLDTTVKFKRNDILE